MEASLIASDNHLLDVIGANDSTVAVAQVLATTRQPIDLTSVSSNLCTFSQPDVVTHYLQVLNNEDVDDQIRKGLKEVGELLYQSFVERLARGDAPSKEAVVEIVCIKHDTSTSDVQEEVRHVFLLQMRTEDESPLSEIAYAAKADDGASTSYQRSNLNSLQAGSKLAGHLADEQFGQKSKLSYTDMITMALSSSSTGCMSVHEIYQWITDNFPHIRAKANKRWQGVVRTTLCQTNKFARVGMVKSGHGGYVWSLAPDTKSVVASRVDGDDIDTDDENTTGQIDQQPIEQDDNIELAYDPNLTSLSMQQQEGGSADVDSTSQLEEMSSDGIMPSVTLFLCDICGKPCTDRSSLKAHQRMHSMPTTHTCRYCAAICADNKALRDHVSEAHADILQHNCQTCQKNFVRYGDLVRHQMTHSGERPFVCATCGKTFAQSGGLKRHMDTHVKGAQQITCNICGRHLASAYCLQRHMRNHVDESSKVACNVCGRRFAFVSVMERHRRGHTGERPYICHLCGKNFRDSGTLVIHMRTHSGERPYVCQYCDKRFRHKTNLNDHIKIHSGQDSHKCDECGVRFTRHVTLLRHKRSSHTQDRPAVSVKAKRQPSQTVVVDECSI